MDMLTKRAFLAGAGVVATLPALPIRAAEVPGGVLRIRRAVASLAPAGPDTNVVQIEGAGGQDGLRLAIGQPARVPVENGLPETIALRWYGLRGTGSLDDAAPDLKPGASGSLNIFPQDGGTALLRAAPSAAHLCEQGAQAVVVVPEVAAPAVDRDIALLLSDWLFASDGSPRFGSTSPADTVASVVTVNGDPRVRDIVVPPRSRLRLRFVNASPQRLMVLSCTGGRPMIAAIDGQPSDLFAPLRNIIPIGPGARYDLLLDAPEATGEQVRFTLKRTRSIAGKPEAEHDILVLRTDGPPAPAKPPITPLRPNPNLPAEIRLEAAKRADLTFDGQPGSATSPPLAWSVNGIAGPVATKPVLSMRQGDAVVFGLVNASSTLVPLHIGGHVVRLLHAKDDGWEPYWRDSLLLPPKSRNHVAFVADRPGRWPIVSGFDDLTLAGLSCFFAVTPR